MMKLRLKIEERTGKRVLFVCPYVTDDKLIYAVYFADGDDCDYTPEGERI